MAKDPKYVRLAARLSDGSLLDLNSGWSISGLDVQEFPDPEKRPAAALFVRTKLANGVLEGASQAEYEEIQEFREAAQQRFLEQAKFLQETKDVRRLMGIGTAGVQAAQVEGLAREQREQILARRGQADATGGYEADQRRREAVIAARDTEVGSSEREAELERQNAALQEELAAVRNRTSQPGSVSTGLPNAGEGGGVVQTGAPAPEAVGAPAGNEDDDDVAYEDMTVDDLKAELKARELPVSGNKDELVARLEADDESDDDEDEDDES